MSFRQIENDIKSGAVNRAVPVLLYGEERFLVDNYEKRLTAMFARGNGGTEDSGEAGASVGGEDPSGQNSLDVSVFYGGEADDDSVIAALETFPMLSPLRTVIVKGHPGLSGPGGGAGTEEAGSTKKSTQSKNGLAEYIAGLPETSRLIFSSNSVNKTRALFKAISKYGTVYEFSRLDEADLQSFVRKRFKIFGASIPPDVLESFVYTTGYLEKDSERDLFTVENDAYKVASFALSEGRIAITHSDIEECLEGVARTDVFAMLDAISSGRKAEAVELLENSIVGGDSAFRLLSLFTGHFEIMLGYKELSAEGHSPAEITKILGERSDWRVKKLGGFAQRFETEKLMWILGRLYGMERDIKSGDIAERLALTVLLAQI